MNQNKNSRRGFIQKAAVAMAATIAAPAILKAQDQNTIQNVPATEGPFRLKYAPSIRMFKSTVGSDDLIDNIRFCYDQGFRAVFDNGLMDRPVEDQAKIAAELARLGMEMGPFVLYADFTVTSFVTNDPDKRAMLLDKMRQGVEVAKRTQAKWALVVPGRYDESLHWDYQTANVVDNLRYYAEIFEPAGLTMVLEPLNTLHDHPGLFLNEMPQAYQICRAVNSPSIKIVDDIYHQQITEGNLIPNIDACYNEIGAFHLGDNPGRNEPTSGEINFKNIFKYLFEKGYQGTLCMEHGKSLSGKEGDARVIAAYREMDAF
ncbi:MAG: TIM barrel protein [Bacteroidales bacterium]|nr:TIM barrel protein [Bacteroidales bacterium]